MDSKIENLVTEGELRELFGMSKEGIGLLRTDEELPYLKITRTKRLYLENDVLKWLENRRVVANKGE